jgi:starch synthase (maltosyl-transferring)
LRIDFVITELFVGGAERCLTQVALGLAEHGARVRIFSLANLPTGPQRLLVDRLQAAGIPISSGGADRARQFLAARRRLVAWLGESPPDICQTFLHHANVVGTFAAGTAGVAVRVGGVRVAEVRPLRIWLERQAVKRMDSVICVSRAVQDFARDRLGCAGSTSVVIPNGVDVSHFSTAAPYDWSQLGWPKNSIVSLFVGRLHPQKGLEQIQTQVDRLAPAGSLRRILLVGDGPLRDQLSAWASSAGRDRVQLLPWQPDVAPLMKAARLLLLPSRYEGLPNVVLEAMASGRPVVCSRVQGSEELFAHDRLRQSFAAGDAASMADLAEAFLHDETLSNEVGASNQAHVCKEFSIPAMVDAYRSHYRMLLARHETTA